MRSSYHHREFGPSAQKTRHSTAPTGHQPHFGTGASSQSAPELSVQIAKARRDARRNSAAAAKLLREWMSDDG